MDDGYNPNSNSKTPEKELPLKEGYQPSKKGFQPGNSNLDPSKPPQGGSGVPPKDTGDKDGGKKE